MRIAFELVEVFLIRIVMKIGALIGAAYHGANQIRVGPNLLITHGWFELVGMVSQPAT
jgi:hypothetical protein